MTVPAHRTRGVIPPLQTLTVEAVVAQSGEDAIHRLVHSLQTHSALGELCQVHHREAGAILRFQHFSSFHIDQLADIIFD